MAKFNTPGYRYVDNRRTGRGPLTTTGLAALPHPLFGLPGMTDFLNAVVTPALPGDRIDPGSYTRDAKSDLFLLAVRHMTGQNSYYEGGAARDTRFLDLTGTLAVRDPYWTSELIAWMRQKANIRSGAIAAAAAFGHAHAGNKAMSGLVRTTVSGALQRADEPGEFVAYWHATYGKNTMPKAVKRGVADALLRLYTPYAVLKYDTASHPMRFGDVLELVQPRQVLGARHQAAVNALSYLLDRRRGRATTAHRVPLMIVENHALRATVASGDVAALLNTDRLRAAGMTWEDVLSLAGDKMPKKLLWESAIPQMGLFALARNLRNFDLAGISAAHADAVTARLSDPAQVARSRMFPYRWYTAYKNAPNSRWAGPLGRALQASTASIPALPGRTRILIDTSGSMQAKISEKSTIALWEAAAVFAYALAARQQHADVEIYGFAGFPYHVPSNPGADILTNIATFAKTLGAAGYNTRIAESLRQTWQHGGHADRVFVFTDMQTQDGDITHAIPPEVPLYGFNLDADARATMNTSVPNRIELGGLTDATFNLIPILERGQDAGWPWEQGAADE